MRDRITAAIDDASVTARALWHTRMFDRLRPRALPVLLRQRRSGASGASTLLRLNAASQPQAEAIVWGPNRFTWVELDRRVDRVAASLQHRHGLGKGDSIVLVMHNRGELLELQAAASRIGAGSVPLSWRSTLSRPWLACLISTSIFAAWCSTSAMS